MYIESHGMYPVNLAAFSKYFRDVLLLDFIGWFYFKLCGGYCILPQFVYAFTCQRTGIMDISTFFS